MTAGTAQTVPASLLATRRRAGFALAAAAVMATGAVTPPWLAWAPSLAVFSMTGATLQWALQPGRRTGAGVDPPAPADPPADPVRTAVLSVLVSTTVVILVLVILDVAGIRIDRASVALSVAAVQLALAVTCVVRGEPPRELMLRVPSRAVTGTIVVAVGAATLIVAVAGIRALAPALPTTPYARISWAAGSSPRGVEPVSAGPVSTTVSIQTAGSAGSVQLTEYLDNSEMAAPITVELQPGPPVDVTVPGSYPILDGCLHRVQVTLSQPGRGGELSVTRYVRGVGACRGAS